MTSVIEIPIELAHFQLPIALHTRLQTLLDQQDSGSPLSEAEQQEAQGLVEVAEFFSLLQLRSNRVSTS